MSTENLYELSKEEIMPNKVTAMKNPICRHEWDKPILHDQLYTCLKCGIVAESPWQYDFAADPRLVLKEMAKQRGFGNFLYHLYDGEGMSHDDKLLFVLYNLIPIKYIEDTTGLLLKKAIEFLKEEQ